MSDDLESVLSAVGGRLRRLRLARGVTLSELSEATGVSVSTLSRLEAGQRRPTLELILPLARAHGVQIDELVGAPQTGDPRVHLRPIVRHGRVHIPLTRRPVGGLQAFKMILPADTAAGSCATPDLKIHEGYEWLYVLSGRLRLILGERDLILSAGEAAEFDTRVPHWLGSAGGEAVELLCLFGKQGERAHLRAKAGPREESADEA